MPRSVLAIAVVGVLSAGAAAAAPSGFDLDLYARILARHTVEVSDLARVRVDYRALRRDPDWPRLLASLAAADPGRLTSHDERLAFWANAYNVLAIAVVVEHDPPRSIRDVGSLLWPVWKRPAGVVGGEERTLDEIEHGIVRPLGDPRAHVAVVCASLSCPPLAREPWRAEQLDTQLDAALRGWLADPRKGLRLDRPRRTVYLSKIFDWFEEDFEAAGGALAFALPYLDEDDRRFVEARRDALNIEYLDYDWRLNGVAAAASQID